MKDVRPAAKSRVRYAGLAKIAAIVVARLSSDSAGSTACASTTRRRRQRRRSARCRCRRPPGVAVFVDSEARQHARAHFAEGGRTFSSPGGRAALDSSQHHRGAESSQYLEFAERRGRRPARAVGSGGRARHDRRRGSRPAPASQARAGQATSSSRPRATAVRQKVKIEAGVTASILPPVPPRPPDGSGWRQ